MQRAFSPELRRSEGNHVCVYLCRTSVVRLSYVCRTSVVPLSYLAALCAVR